MMMMTMMIIVSDCDRGCIDHSGNDSGIVMLLLLLLMMMMMMMMTMILTVMVMVKKKNKKKRRKKHQSDKYCLKEFNFLQLWHIVGWFRTLDRG